VLSGVRSKSTWTGSSAANIVSWGRWRGHAGDSNLAGKSSAVARPQPLWTEYIAMTGRRHGCHKGR